MKKFKRLQALLLSAVLIFSLVLYACGGATSESSEESVNSSVESSMDSSGETSQEDDLSEDDKDLLRYYREPNIEEDFEDNLICVILKSKYSTMKTIGFSDFPFASIDQVYSISNYRDTIYANENKRLTLRERTNQSLRFELYTHSKENVLKLIDEIDDLEIVLVAEPQYNYDIEYNWAATDPYYSEQWGLNGTYGIDIEEAWNINLGTENVKVGVFESGAELNHEDLSGIISDEILESIDETSGHGTHVAGIIGAKKNNFGVSGISSSQMFLLNGTLTDMLDRAEKLGIRVVNASFSHYVNGAPAGYNVNNFNAIKDFDGLFIAAAGNDSKNIDDEPLYPASYDLPNLIAVGNLKSNNSKATGSNYGDKVEIYAPGSHILSTFPKALCNAGTVSTTDGERLRCECEWTNKYTADGSWEWRWNGNSHYAIGYHHKSGTSMAAPHVTGVAALLLAQNTNLTPVQLKTAILNGSDTISLEMNDDSVQTVKKLNAAKAMQYVLDHYGNTRTLKYNDQEFSERELYADYSYTLKMDVQNAYNYEFIISTDDEIEVSLFDENLNPVTISTTTSNNGCQINFSKNLALGKYYLKIECAYNTEYCTFDLTIKGEPHTHSYDYQYIRYDNTHHQALCICGIHILKPHIVRINDGSSLASRCALCNAIVPNSGLLSINSVQVQYVTANGSFIAPNGVIYLVDEDFEAYLDGTLIFYKKGTIPIVA